MKNEYFIIWLVVGVLVWFFGAIILKRWSNFDEPDALCFFIGFTWPAALLVGIMYLIYWLMSISSAFFADLGKKD